MNYEKQRIEQKAINEEHISKPKPGDFWNEMYFPICVVIANIGKNVMICKTRKNVGKNKWTWDLEKLDILNLREFKEWLSYKSDKILGYWCDCNPEAHKWVVEALNKI